MEPVTLQEAGPSPPQFAEYQNVPLPEDSKHNF